MLSKQNNAPAPSANDYDQDTQEILKEMQKDGFDTGVAGIETPPAANPAADPAPAPTPDADPAPVDDEPPADDEPEADPNAGEPDANPEDTPPQTPPTSSLAQSKRDDYWRQKANDLEAALADSKKKISEYEAADAFKHVDETINTIAKKYNANPQLIKEILTIGKDAFIPPELRQAMTEIQTARADDRVWDTNFDKFDSEFANGVYPLLLEENPNITQAEIDRVYRQLGGGDRNGPAWADENAKTPLLTLYTRIIKPTQRRSGGESTTVRSRTPGAAGASAATSSKPLNEITPGEISGMTDEQFDTYSEGLRSAGPKLQR